MSGGPSSRVTARHTIVLSDVHLCDAEPEDPRRPLWKRFKRKDLFVDPSFVRFLEYVETITEGPVELVFNGDLFDFDAMAALPESPKFTVSFFERLRGLGPEEDKSLFKIERILVDHAEWFGAVAAFLARGHRVVFVIGNHDLELHWPAVQAAVRAALGNGADTQSRVRFCEFFYVSNADTLIEHGNQFDAYCLCPDPLHPFVDTETVRLRKPFGDIAGRFMLNGMGLFNPYVEESFIRSLREYIVFFYRYVVRIQPLLLFSWMWSATATLVLSLREGFLPTLRDPLRLEERMRDVARRANSSPAVARALLALTVHPAIFSPVKVARELWLDRFVLLLLAAMVSFQLISTLNFFVIVSVWWMLLPFALLMGPFVFYARTVNSDISNTERTIHKRIPTAAAAAGVSRVILGHTHRERHVGVGGVELINTGTWSPAYSDVECTRPYGKKCFAWVRPDPAGPGRISELRQWLDPGSEVTRPDAPPQPLIQTRPRLRPVLSPPPTVQGAP